MEDKKKFCDELGKLIGRCTRNIDVESIVYVMEEFGEYAVIHYVNGYKRAVNITGDSCIAIMCDVYKALI